MRSWAVPVPIHCRPVVFGCQAPDTGNAEILAHYGTEEHKRTYLQPLLDGKIFSSSR